MKQILCAVPYAIALIVSVVGAIEQGPSENASKPRTQLTEASPVLLVSTLNGELAAVQKNSGVVLWSRWEHPVLKVPTSGTPSAFLPDPKDGSLYIVVTEESPVKGEARRASIKKLPFTIPQLVTASPCRSSDGMLYTGQKMDVWFAIDLATGEKKETISFHGSDNVCPQSKSGVAYIGRSEYHLAMFDAVTGEKRWNATYYDYAATAANIPEVMVADYDLVHMASSEAGLIYSFDKKSGDFLWEAEFSSPIVALYLIDNAHDPQSHLRSLPFTSLAQRTMNDVNTRLLRKTWKNYLETEWESLLYPALYIGMDSLRKDLFALPALVDDNVPLIPSDGGARNVPLLEGPRATAGRRRDIYEGYYEVPDDLVSSLAPQRQISGQTVKAVQRREGMVIQPRPDKVPLTEPAEPTLTPDERFARQVSVQLFWIEVALATLMVALVATFLWLYPQARMYQQSSKSFNLRISGETGMPVRELEMDESGICTVGKISYNANEKLGAGGNGTVVFRGQFDGRDVAVKRILPVCYSLAFREVKLLRETDEHPNVVRYFCMEEDPHFYYIALELCAATLTDYVERKGFERRNLDPLIAIHQAALGLEHLHGLDIAHRDVKPQNVLLAERNGQLKVMISDFGLCKKLTHGDRSFSKKSGVLGTEGWIAPEVLEGDDTSRVTKAIDIFSLGCVFYYALSNGLHPFGDSLERQANIRRGKCNLTALSKQHITAKCLIHQMLSKQSRLRPTSAQVTRHPAFWDKLTELNFFQEVSDRLEKEPFTSPVVLNLEKNGLKVINNENWIDQITEELQKDLRRFRSYKGSSVRDLLRVIRNKKHHYRELPPELQAELGSIPGEYVSYFSGRFPYLLVHTYAAMQSFRHDVPLLAQYYAPVTSSPAVDLLNHPDLDLMPAPTNTWKSWRTNRMQKQVEPQVKPAATEDPPILDPCDTDVAVEEIDENEEPISTPLIEDLEAPEELKTDSPPRTGNKKKRKAKKAA